MAATLDSAMIGSGDEGDHLRDHALLDTSTWFWDLTSLEPKRLDSNNRVIYVSYAPKIRGRILSPQRGQINNSNEC